MNYMAAGANAQNLSNSSLNVFSDFLKDIPFNPNHGVFDEIK